MKKTTYQTPTTTIVNMAADQPMMLPVSGKIDNNKPTGPALSPTKRWSNGWE